MPSAGFEPAITITKRPMTYALERSATGIGTVRNLWTYILDDYFFHYLPLLHRIVLVLRISKERALDINWFCIIKVILLHI
jgi:hypothetical protein